MLVNGAHLRSAGRRPRRTLSRRSRRPRCSAAALIFGAVRMRQMDAIVARAPRLKVGLVQPNFAYSIDGEFSRDEAVRQLTALQEQSRRLQHAGAQLLVWSEGSYPVTLPRDFTADFPPDSAAMIRRGFDAPASSAPTCSTRRTTRPSTRPCCSMRRTGGGPLRQGAAAGLRRIHSRHRAFPWLRKLHTGRPGRFTAGAGPGVLSLARAPAARSGARAR